MYDEIKTAVIYARYSSANQTEQSIEGQVRVCKDFCQHNGINVIDMYIDRAASASKDLDKRVQFLKMIKDSDKHNFDAVIVYKLDRFSRSRYDMATYKYRLKKNGIMLISATENISTDPEGIILESVLEGMAEFYSAELSQKITRGLRESAYKHNSIGGSIPFGYTTIDKKYVIIPEQAQIVREAYELYAVGTRVADICRILNEKGYRTAKGKKFNKASFTKLFHNEKYIGVYKFHDYRAENAIPAIIDRDLWERVQRRVKAQKPSGTFKAKRVYALSGKLFCGHCGCQMSANSNGQNYFYYECYGKKTYRVDCTKRNMRKEYIERVVAQDALSMLTDENIALIADIAVKANRQELEANSNTSSIRDKIHQVEVSLSNIAKAIEGGDIPQTLVKRMMDLEKDKAALEKELKREEKKIDVLDKELVVHWLEQFKGGDVEDESFVKALIDLLVNSVTVWDEPDGYFRVEIAYNLSDNPAKTYRLDRDGAISDLAPKVQHGMSNPTIKGTVLIRSIRCSQWDNYLRNHPKLLPTV